MEKKAHYQTAEERGLQERLELSKDHTHVDTWQSLKQRLIKVEERGNRPQDLRPVKIDRVRSNCHSTHYSRATLTL